MLRAAGRRRLLVEKVLRYVLMRLKRDATFVTRSFSYRLFDVPGVRVWTANPENAGRRIRWSA
jgi:hypothetical protein